jgi:DNA replication protein DnaC
MSSRASTLIHVCATRRDYRSRGNDSARWRHIIDELTVADAILDRIVHNAHRLKRKGDSLRRKRASPTQPA